MIKVFVRDVYAIIMAQDFKVAQLVHQIVKLVVQFAGLWGRHVR